MKKIVYISLFLIFPFFAFSQFSSDLIVFNRNGENFKLYLNNVLVNRQFTNKVYVPNVGVGNNNIRIIFQNYGEATYKVDVFIEPNSEFVVALFKAYGTSYTSEVYKAVDYTLSFQDWVNSSYNLLKQLDNGFDDYNNQNNGYNNQNNGYNNQNNGYNNQNNGYNNQNNGYNNNNYNPPHNNHNNPCVTPMSQASFNDAMSVISEKSFDSDKLTIAKQIANSNCLLSEQVKQIANLFSFEDSKLKFAKHAYTRTYDPQNYYVVNSVFKFSSNVDELQEFIEAH